MIKWLQTLVILWEKSKFLRLMELESSYIQSVHADKIWRDLPELRKELASLRAIKSPKTETTKKMIGLEADINETEKFRQMVQSSEEKSIDLKNQIEQYKRKLWY